MDGNKETQEMPEVPPGLLRTALSRMSGGTLEEDTQETLRAKVRSRKHELGTK